MYFTPFLAIIPILAGVKSDTISDLESAWTTVIDDVNSMNSKVEGYSASQGLIAALDIQSSYSTLYSDTKKLVSKALAVNSITDSEAQELVAYMAAGSDDIAQLLRNLGAQADQFSSVGVQGIVSADLSSLQPQLLTVISQIYTLAPCEEVSSVTSLITPVLASLTAANDIYTVANSNSPSAPSAC